MTQPAKTVAAIHDLSGVGRCALTVVLPTLSAMGLQACPLPTAVLSAHTAFPDIAATDLTAFLRPYLAHWKKLGLAFDCVYAGYLASPEQVGIVRDFLRDQPRAIRVIDPVMGDDGQLYAGMAREMPEKIRALLADADVVTPNMTEYAYLTGDAFSLRPRTVSEASEMLAALVGMGAKAAVITSLPLEDGLANAYLVRGGSPGFCRFDRLPVHYPGTGDLFASVLTGALVNGQSLGHAVARATRFTRHAIRLSLQCGGDVRYGVQLERALPELLSRS